MAFCPSGDVGKRNGDRDGWRTPGGGADELAGGRGVVSVRDHSDVQYWTEHRVDSATGSQPLCTYIAGDGL